MKAWALAVFIVASIVAGGAGQSMGGIYGLAMAPAKVAAKVPKPAAKIARGTIERVGDIAGIGMDLAAKGGQTSGTTQGLPGASGSNPWGGSVTRDCGQCSCELVWEKKIAGREFDNCITEATLKCTCNYDRCKTAHAAHCIANLAS
ncbi:uncharacterized protein LOC142579785 isoform X3 [Dermacentor variabilis]|uniref:uncharacterized protein LOC142579785 isoform X3 n=1 Tax=Dermacentor variabilis TaxID=34621 RepID=UPI003F5C8745